jgi:hypothetical protein
MRKFSSLLFFFVVMLFFTANNAFAGGAVKLGLDFGGNHEWSASGRTNELDDVQTGFSLALELFGSVHKNVALGGGIIYQIPRDAEYDGRGAAFNFIPFYALIRIKSDSDKIAPYGIGQIGYNLFLADSDYTGPADTNGGIYYGLGAGILIKKRFSVEALYSVNNGELEYRGDRIDVKNSQFTLNFGINF